MLFQELLMKITRVKYQKCARTSWWTVRRRMADTQSLTSIWTIRTRLFCFRNTVLFLTLSKVKLWRIWHSGLCSKIEKMRIVGINTRKKNITLWERTKHGFYQSIFVESQKSTKYHRCQWVAQDRKRKQSGNSTSRWMLKSLLI